MKVSCASVKVPTRAEVFFWGGGDDPYLPQDFSFKVIVVTELPLLKIGINFIPDLSVEPSKC
jgi:hypothetical protein